MNEFTYLCFVCLNINNLIKNMSYLKQSSYPTSSSTTSYYQDRQSTYKEYLRDCNIYQDFKESNFKYQALVRSINAKAILVGNEEA
jgi:hypothetical protein